MEEELVTATVSITTLLSVVTLLGWLYALSVLSPQAAYFNLCRRALRLRIDLVLLDDSLGERRLRNP